MQIVKAWRTECFSVISTTESTFYYFPNYSRTVYSIKFFLIYKVVCLLILYNVRAGRTECYSVFSTTECTVYYITSYSQTVYLTNSFLFTKLFAYRFYLCQSRAYQIIFSLQYYRMYFPIYSQLVPLIKFFLINLSFYTLSELCVLYAFRYSVPQNVPNRRFWVLGG